MMGADGEFERRQAELTHLNTMSGAERQGAEATEEDVVWSTVGSVEPGGFMREYIELGVLAHVDGNCLYVHGGIVGGPGEHAVGAMPQSDDRIDNVQEWVAALNAWKGTQVQEWSDAPLWCAEPSAEETGLEEASEMDLLHTPAPVVPWTPHSSLPRMRSPWETREGHTLSGGGQALQDYGNPCWDGPTVVLGRHLQKTGMPMGVPDEAMELLNKSGIRRVVVGHTPHGTCPTIIKTGGPGMEEPGVVVVMADTSFSDMKAADNRGRAVSEVLLLDDGQVSQRTALHRVAFTRCPKAPSAVDA
jgi:hypothetical protein